MCKVTAGLESSDCYLPMEHHNALVITAQPTPTKMCGYKSTTVEVNVFASKNGEVPLVTLEVTFASVITMVKAPLHLSRLVASQAT